MQKEKIKKEPLTRPCGKSLSLQQIKLLEVLLSRSKNGEGYAKYSHLLKNVFPHAKNIKTVKRNLQALGNYIVFEWKKSIVWKGKRQWNIIIFKFKKIKKGEVRSGQKCPVKVDKNVQFYIKEYNTLSQEDNNFFINKKNYLSSEYNSTESINKKHNSKKNNKALQQQNNSAIVSQKGLMPIEKLTETKKSYLKMQQESNLNRTNLTGYIFRAFDTDLSTKLQENLLVKSFIDNKVCIQFKNKITLVENQKVTLRECIRKAYGENVDIFLTPTKNNRNTKNTAKKGGSKKEVLNATSSYSTPETPWGKVRQEFINGSVVTNDAIGIDKHWFSKVEDVFDEDEKALTLKTNSSLVYDWINQKFLFKLQGVAKDFGYSLKLMQV